MARMRILTANEQAAFDRPPVFNHRERKRFLDLPKGLTDTAATLRTPPSGRIGFLVMCGHFRAATGRVRLSAKFHVKRLG